MSDGSLSKATLFTERVELYEYTKLREFPEFIQEIKAKARSAFYVAARERRGFNFVFRFLPDLDNLVSTSGLLLHYGGLARYCREYGEFPKVLILDDLTLHGRGLFNYLWELKQLVFSELNRISETKQYTIAQFENMFYRSVEVFVYAESQNTGFFNKELIKFSAYKKNMPWPQIHSLSMQMSDALIRWEIANTSFSFSARSERLYSILLGNRRKNGRRWRRVEWKCGGESSLLFLRFAGDDSVNYISTIRTFPLRSHDASPQISSFTLFGDLHDFVMRVAFSELARIFEENELRVLAGILSDENPGIISCQGQLLSFCLSVIDFFDFCDDLLEGEDVESFLEDLRGDLHKISCNFGGGPEIFIELSKLTFDAEIRNQISSVRRFLQNRADKLISVPATNCFFSKKPAKKDMDFYYDKVENIFFRVGFRDECHVARLADKPYLFAEWDYQSYGTGISDIYGKDGVISFRDFWHLLENDSEISLSGDAVCGFMAAYLLAIDYGVMGSRVRYLRDERQKLTLLAKAGELSAFYLPKKLSFYIPAFAKVERFYYYVAPSRELAVSRFLKYLSKYKLFEDELSEEKQNEIQGQVEVLYQCGHDCSQWNFVNITHQNTKKNQQRQNLSKHIADQFLSLS